MTKRQLDEDDYDKLFKILDRRLQINEECAEFEKQVNQEYLQCEEKVSKMIELTLEVYGAASVSTETSNLLNLKKFTADARRVDQIKLNFDILSNEANILFEDIQQKRITLKEMKKRAKPLKKEIRPLIEKLNSIDIEDRKSNLDNYILDDFKELKNPSMHSNNDAIIEFLMKELKRSEQDIYHKKNSMMKIHLERIDVNIEILENIQLEKEISQEINDCIQALMEIHEFRLKECVSEKYMKALLNDMAVLPSDKQEEAIIQKNKQNDSEKRLLDVNKKITELKKERTSICKRILDIKHCIKNFEEHLENIKDSLKTFNTDDEEFKKKRKLEKKK